MVTRDGAFLWTDGRYHLQASEQLSREWTLMKSGVCVCMCVYVCVCVCVSVLPRILMNNAGALILDSILANLLDTIYLDFEQAVAFRFQLPVVGSTYTPAHTHSLTHQATKACLP